MASRPRRAATPRRSAGATVASHLSAAKDLLADKLGRLETQQISARTKTEKKKKGKEIAKIKGQIRKLVS